MAPVCLQPTIGLLLMCDRIMNGNVMPHLMTINVHKYKSAVAVAAAASEACLREGPTSWYLGRVLGDSTAALTPEEGRPPVPTEPSEGYAWSVALRGCGRPLAHGEDNYERERTRTEGSRTTQRDK